MTKITFFRRLGMSLLFVVAFLSTVSAISNLTFTDMYNLFETHKEFQLNNHALLAEKTVTLQAKSNLNNRIENEKSEEANDLDALINLDQYPTQNVIATGYTAGFESTGKTPDHPEYGITFSGVNVTRDLYSTIAADLNVFPIGTILYIPDYGYGVVADKGSAINGNKIDLYYQTVADVYSQWGKREVDVYIIEMGDGHLTKEVLERLNENQALQVFRDQIMNNP